LKDCFVDRIVACKKYIPRHTKNVLDPRKMKEDNGHYRRNIDLDCDGYRLRMSIRQLVDDPLNFSVLLIYSDDAGHTYIIRRYNGTTAAMATRSPERG